MFKFFRKIRQSLFSENKFSKHLPYTIGEILLLVYLAMLTSCVTNRLDGPLRTESLTKAESEQINIRLKDLYQSFCYGAGEEPDWELMRSVFFAGAQFVGEAPAGEAPRPQTVDEFISSWQNVIRGSSPPTVETSERIISTKADKVGKLIRVDVLFQAMKANDPSPRKPGLDSLVFANVGGVWKILSFVVHYESKI